MEHPIEALINRCRQNDRTAQRQLYEQFSAFVMRTCYRYATDLEEAKDMLQNTFVRVFHYLPDYDPAKGTFTNWIHRIAVHEAIAVKRKKQRWNLSDAVFAEADASCPPEVIQRLTVEELRAVIDKMPEIHRTILMLHYFDGLAHDEIATLMGIEISSSRARLSRAKTELIHRWNLNQQIGL